MSNCVTVCPGRPSYPRQGSSNHRTSKPFALDGSRRVLLQAAAPGLSLQAAAPRAGPAAAQASQAAPGPAGVVPLGVPSSGPSAWEDSLPLYPSPYNATPADSLPRHPDFFLGFATAVRSPPCVANPPCMAIVDWTFWRPHNFFYDPPGFIDAATPRASLELPPTWFH